MSLLTRVATLIRANLNDLVDQAEDPEKLLKQLLLDMENQYLQLKTQTAVAVAGQHMLEGKRQESAGSQTEWMNKAELALAHQDEGLSRAAIERALTHQSAAANFAAQMEQQATQVNALRESLAHLEAKMMETRAKIDVLVARHRRAKVARQTAASGFDQGGNGAVFDRMKAKISEAEAFSLGYAAVNQPGVQARLEQVERNDKVEGLLAELKRRRDGN